MNTMVFTDGDQVRIARLLDDSAGYPVGTLGRVINPSCDPGMVLVLIDDIEPSWQCFYADELELTA